MTTSSFTPTVTKTRGGAFAWTERAKDVIVEELRSYLSLNYENVLKEMPQIERYGLAGQTSAESFVNIFTALPHVEQRIPFIAIMSAPGTERKMGIGRQVIQTFHDPDSGLPTIRECFGGDMNVIIEIAATDTNERSELVDIIHSFFVVYLEQFQYSILGDGTADPVTGVPRLHQLIMKSQASISGETDQPRPEGEPFNRIYFNRITVPIIFLDYVDREGDDISICFNPNLQPEDDENFVPPFPFPEPGAVTYADHDDFESNDAPNAKWKVFANSDAVVSRTVQTSEVIRGLASVKLEPVGTIPLALLLNRKDDTTSGRLRVRFNLGAGTTLILFCMLQGDDPTIDPSYHLIVKSGQPTRLSLKKGVIGGVVTELGQGSRVVVPGETDLAAQLEWKIDPRRKRIRLRGYVTSCGSDAFGELIKRLELIDATEAFLSSEGEGFGFEPDPDATVGIGAVVVDDAEILDEINPIVQSNPARIGP